MLLSKPCGSQRVKRLLEGKCSNNEKVQTK